VECSPRVGSELLPHAKEIKYLSVLFTRGQNGAGDGQTDWCGICSNAGAVPVRCGEERSDQNNEIADTSGQMSFLRRVAGLSVRDRVRISDIQRELGVELLLLHVERSQLRWFGRFSGHVRLGKDPGADPEPAGGFWVWPGNASGSPRSSTSTMYKFSSAMCAHMVQSDRQAVTLVLTLHVLSEPVPILIS